VTGSQSQDEDLSAYNQDWMGKYKGASQLVLRPKTTAQVSQILQYCNTKHLALVPQAGNTSLVIGSVPIYDEIVLSTSLMNKVIEFDPIAGTLVCQAGCILEHVNKYLEERGFIMPLDLAAKGSCQIGGNIAAGAGGLRFLRYKSLHANVLGYVVVFSN